MILSRFLHNSPLSLSLQNLDIMFVLKYFEDYYFFFFASLCLFKLPSFLYKTPLESVLFNGRQQLIGLPRIVEKQMFEQLKMFCKYTCSFLLRIHALNNSATK